MSDLDYVNVHSSLLFSCGFTLSYKITFILGTIWKHEKSSSTNSATNVITHKSILFYSWIADISITWDREKDHQRWQSIKVEDIKIYNTSDSAIWRHDFPQSSQWCHSIDPQYCLQSHIPNLVELSAFLTCNILHLHHDPQFVCYQIQKTNMWDLIINQWISFVQQIPVNICTYESLKMVKMT